jgi:hypothetical protein
VPIPSFFHVEIVKRVLWLVVRQGEVDGHTVTASFLRKWESRVHQQDFWMPAFAGMTTAVLALQPRIVYQQEIKGYANVLTTSRRIDAYGTAG